MKTLLILLGLVIFLPAQAAEQPAACKPLAWPLARTLGKREVMAEIKKLPREEVIRYAVGELTRPPQQEPVDVILLQFLFGTESDNRLHGFYGGITYLTYGQEPKALFKAWPKVPERVQQLSAQRVCQLYQDTLADPVEE